MKTTYAKTKQDNVSGEVYSINRAGAKKTAKTAVKKLNLLKDFGLEGDVHGGPGPRQVSLLAIESIKRQLVCPKVKKKGVSLGPGDFAENITTKGLDLTQLKIGDRLRIGDRVILEVSAIGKECHKYCGIYEKIGDCVMPREGIFAKVLNSGEISMGDMLVRVK